MTVQEWDAEQAVVRGPLDEELEGCYSIDRYGVAAFEERTGEPLSVALAQEEADLAPPTGSDDQWVLVEDESDIDNRLFDDNRHAAEELAMYLLTPQLATRR